jgi:pSer/pThr/pTyr-binding forkhead associated (FHA) protein
VNYKLEYFVNDEWETFYLNKKTITLGKLSKNDLQINDSTISRNHCKFIKAKNIYKIIDLNSTNGTFVNGKIINEKILNVGDNIAIGKTILKFLAAPKKEDYYDLDDQKISMVIPLSEELKVEKEKKLEFNKLNLLTSLTKLGKNLISSSSIEETFEKVGQLIFELLNPKRLFIFSYDLNHKQLLLKYSQTIGKSKSEKVNISKTIAMKAIKEKVAILSSNTKDDNRFNGAESIILYGSTFYTNMDKKFYIWADIC